MCPFFVTNLYDYCSSIIRHFVTQRFNHTRIVAMTMFSTYYESKNDTISATLYDYYTSGVAITYYAMFFVALYYLRSVCAGGSCYISLYEAIIPYCRLGRGSTVTHHHSLTPSQIHNLNVLFILYLFLSNICVCIRV